MFNILSFQKIKLLLIFYYYIRGGLSIDKSIKQGEQYDIILGIKIASGKNLQTHSLCLAFYIL